MSQEHGFSISMKLLENYMFQVDFGDMGDVITDEPEPLGTGEGPNPVRLLAASVANCLAASLLFALRKQKDNPEAITAIASGQLERVEGRWRLKKMKVDLYLGDAVSDLPGLQKALNQFEDFCVVTQSVRSGIDVEVSVYDADQQVLSI